MPAKEWASVVTMTWGHSLAVQLHTVVKPLAAAPTPLARLTMHNLLHSTACLFFTPLCSLPAPTPGSSQLEAFALALLFPSASLRFNREEHGVPSRASTPAPQPPRELSLWLDLRAIHSATFKPQVLA